MEYGCIEFTRRDGCYRITLNRPDRLNAFNEEMHQEVADAVSRVEQDSGARVLLLTGAGRAFCAGQDLSERGIAGEVLDLGRAIDRYYNPLVKRLAALPLPVVCAVNGTAAGAGVNLALACDIVVARRSAKFVQAFSSIGLVPDTGGSWTLPRAIGQARALGFTLLGEPLTADKAESIGLIWKSIDDASFDGEVDALLERLARAPTYGLGQAKRLIRSAIGRSLEQALDEERDVQRSCGWSPDYIEGIRAFKEKRPANFTGAGPVEPA